MSFVKLASPLYIMSSSSGVRVSTNDDFKASPVTSSSLTKNSLSEISNIFGIVYVSEVFFADTESATCLLSFCLSSHTFAYAGLVRFTGILYTTPLPL